MGKTKKQRRKEQDFRKPKLKVGKKRPEGDNVTKTSFQAASIQLTSQLQEKQEPTNRRKLTLQDLLGQLNHYNSSIRIGALEGMKELFSTHPEVLTSNLGKIINKLSEKIMDSDKRARGALLSCLSHVFEATSEAEMDPFVEVIVAHLKCAMTHINEDIQIDSMLIFDQCLLCFPTCFARYGKKFFDTISAFMTKSFKSNEKKGVTSNNTSKVGFGKGVNTVRNIEPKSKIYSLQVKSTMLRRINHLLGFMLESSVQNIERKTEEIHFNDIEVDIIHLQQKLGFNTYDLEDLSSFLEDKNEMLQENNEMLTINDVSLLLPFLVDTWVECSPYQFGTGIIDKHLDVTILDTISNITSIIRYLFSILPSILKDQPQVASLSIIDSFKEHVVKYFPFEIPKQDGTNLKNKVKVSLEQIGSALLVVNTNIAETLCTLMPLLPEHDALKEQWMNSLVNYLSTTLNNGSLSLLQSHNQTIVNMADVLIRKEAAAGLSLTILQSMERFYRRSNASLSNRITLVQVLKGLLHKQSTSELLRNERISKWMQLLANDISKMLSPSQIPLYRELIEFFLQLSKQDSCNKALRSTLTKVLSELFGTQVQKFKKLPLDLQIRSAEMLYYLEDIPFTLMKNIALLCQSGMVSVRVRKYLVFIILYGSSAFSGGLCRNLDVPLYLSFVLSVVTGYTQQDLENIQSCKSHSPSFITPTILSQEFLDSIGYKKVEKEDEESDLASHMAVVQICVDGLKLQPFYDHLPSLLVDHINLILKKYSMVPEKTALGLMLLVKGIEADNEEMMTPLISSSIMLYESSEIVNTRGEIFTNTEKAFQSDISRVAVELLQSRSTYLTALLEYWRDHITETADGVLIVGIAESLLFVMKILKEKKLRNLTSNLVDELTNTEALRSKQDVLTQLKYTASLME